MLKGDFTRSFSTLRDRFEAKILLVSGGCVEWQARRNLSGYGTIKVGGKSKLAHHVAWFLEHGVWPRDQLLHHCDNRACVNASHLFEGSAQDNVADMIMKGRQAKGQAKADHKLTPRDVRRIRGLRDLGMMYKDIALIHDVSNITALKICRFEKWKHVV